MDATHGKLQIMDDGIRLQYSIAAFDISWLDHLTRQIRDRFKLTPMENDEWWIHQLGCVYDRLGNHEVMIKIAFIDDWGAPPNLLFWADTPESNDMLRMIADYIEGMDVNFASKRASFQALCEKIALRAVLLVLLATFLFVIVGFAYRAIVYGFR